MKKKSVSIIGTVGLPAKYGGWETLTNYLCLNLHNDYDITVFCSGKRYTEKPETYNGVKLKYIQLDANGIESIPYDILSIYKSLKFSDTIVILGVSGCISLPFFKLFTKKKLIVNIDGLEWKRDKWGKFAKMFLKVSEYFAVKYADIVVSDNRAIQNYVSTEYKKDSELITYGSDHAKQLPLTKEILDKYSFLEEKYAFKVCRIEPENNLDIILESFRKYSDLNLVIIGNWSNSEYGINLKSKYSSNKNIYLLDPIYDQSILNQIRSNAYVYIHGHSAGGTNPSLVEAMYLGLPIFSFAVSYNIETTHSKAQYFKTEEDLIELLKTVSSSQLSDISKDLKEVADENYIWSKISEKYSKIF